jgi:hypothetical protein
MDLEENDIRLAKAFIRFPRIGKMRAPRGHEFRPAITGP